MGTAALLLLLVGQEMPSGKVSPPLLLRRVVATAAALEWSEASTHGNAGGVVGPAAELLMGLDLAPKLLDVCDHLLVIEHAAIGSGSRLDKRRGDRQLRV